MRHPQDQYGDPDLKLEGLSIWALGRQFPNSEDYWDGNWMTVHAHVEAPGARIDAYGSWLRTDEIEAFHEQLEALNRDLKGTAGRCQTKLREASFALPLLRFSGSSHRFFQENTGGNAWAGHPRYDALDLTKREIECLARLV